MSNDVEYISLPKEETLAILGDAHSTLGMLQMKAESGEIQLDEEAKRDIDSMFTSLSGFLAFIHR